MFCEDEAYAENRPILHIFDAPILYCDALTERHANSNIEYL